MEQLLEQFEKLANLRALKMRKVEQYLNFYEIDKTMKIW